MTTNITALAQREKFEAWVITQICISKSTLEGLRTSDGYRNSTLSGRDYNLMWNLWKAAGAELVEALEKAKGMETYWKTQCRGITDHCEELQARIAELESRTVTVKLPKPHAHLIWIQAGHAPDDYWDDVAVSHSEKDRCCDGSERYPVYARWEIEEMLAAAGIKVEAD